MPGTYYKTVKDAVFGNRSPLTSSRTVSRQMWVNVEKQEIMEKAWSHLTKPVLCEHTQLHNIPTNLHAAVETMSQNLDFKQ